MIPNAIEFLESLGFTFSISEDGRTVDISYPNEVKDLSAGYLVDTSEVWKGLAEMVCKEKWASDIRWFLHERERQRKDRLARVYKGGPLDGQLYDGWHHSKTFVHRIRHAWYAVYVKKLDQKHADFMGYATSEKKAKLNMLVKKGPREP